MSELEEINEKLDAIILDFFETLGALFREQEELNDLLKDGFFNMSRARYSMGAKSVGVLQYNDREMRASMKIGTDDDKFHLWPVNPSAEIENFSEPSKGNEDSDVSGLRKRNIENIGSYEMKTVETRKEEKKKAAMSYDPLKWFGVLVPQSLRQSRGQFKKALELTVSVANRKRELMDMKSSYEDLKVQKEKLQKA